MKTTLELPDDLFREIKMRAVSGGRKLKDEIAHLLQLGLEIEEPVLAKPKITIDPKSGLPIITGGKKPKEHTLTPDRLQEILLEQEVDAHRNAS